MKDAVVDLKLARKAVSRPQEPQEEREEPVTPLETEEIKTGDETEWQQTFCITGSFWKHIGCIVVFRKSFIEEKTG